MLDDLATYPAEEEAFLQQMHDRPDDEFLPLVYADWLDDQGDPRGTILRLVVEREAKQRHGRSGINRRAVMTAEIKEMLVATGVAWHKHWFRIIFHIIDLRAEVMYCTMVAEEETNFSEVCSNSWSSLQFTDNCNVRFCQDCREQVHFCASREEAADHARAGHCIAVPSQFKGDVWRDLRSDRIGLTLGRPAMPPSISEALPPAKSRLRRWADALFGRGGK